MAMILCCGEALIDMLPSKDGKGFVPHAGGAVFNTAIALGRLGAPTAFFSGIADDFMGEILQTALREANVDASRCVVAKRPSTLAFVRLVDGQASYAFYDENTAGRMLSLADLPNVQAQALFFGGISLAVEPCGSVYEALMMREAPLRVTMVDPNIRPGFITDEVGFRARLSRMMSAADIIKLSTEDLDWLSHGQRDAFITQLLDAGTSIVFITDGAVGATAYIRGAEYFEPAQRVTVVDTVGAGDTFNSGVLANLLSAGVLEKTALRTVSEDKIRSALCYGIKAAAVTVSRAGANPPRAEDLI